MGNALADRQFISFYYDFKNHTHTHSQFAYINHTWQVVLITIINKQLCLRWWASSRRNIHSISSRGEQVCSQVRIREVLRRVQRGDSYWQIWCCGTHGTMGACFSGWWVVSNIRFLVYYSAAPSLPLVKICFVDGGRNGVGKRKYPWVVSSIAAVDRWFSSIRTECWCTKWFFILPLDDWYGDFV